MNQIFWRRTVASVVLAGGMIGMSAVPGTAASLPVLRDAGNSVAQSDSEPGRFMLSGIKAERRENGAPKAVTATLTLSSGLRYEATSDGRLQFVDPAGKIVDSWGTMVKVDDNTTFVGVFSKIDDTHVRFDIEQVKTKDRRVGFGRWLGCIGDKARESLVNGAITGCIGGLIGSGPGCLFGAAVGGGGAAFGSTLQGVFTC